VRCLTNIFTGRTSDEKGQCLEVRHQPSCFDSFAKSTRGSDFGQAHSGRTRGWHRVGGDGIELAADGTDRQHRPAVAVRRQVAAFEDSLSVSNRWAPPLTASIEVAPDPLACSSNVPVPSGAACVDWYRRWGAARPRTRFPQTQQSLGTCWQRLFLGSAASVFTARGPPGRDPRAHFKMT
jgi:hypothetical protein